MIDTKKRAQRPFSIVLNAIYFLMNCFTVVPEDESILT